ncbi:ankyrin repeat-containing domain protein [Trichoderma evansii]
MRSVLDSTRNRASSTFKSTKTASFSGCAQSPRWATTLTMSRSDKRDGHSFDTLELFVHHFLREGSIFATFGLEHLHEEHILTELHLHDIQSQKNRSMSEDLDLLDEAIDELDEEDIKGPRHPFLFINEPFLSQLRAAIRQRDLIAVHSLLAMDPGSVDAKTLCLAIRYYEKTVFHLLLKHGAQVDGAGFIAEPLYRAAKAGHLDAVQLLISYGANKEGGNSCISATPLSGAASGGHFEIVQYLVEEKGANIMGKRFKSSLSRAIKHRHTHIVDYLLKVGANVLEENAEILSQLEETNKVVYGDILERSLARMDNYNRQDLFSRALSEGNLVVVRYLVKTDRKENFSALAAAASKGHFAIVRYLVEAGAIVNPDTRHLAADRYRRECLQECSTPLAVAASNGHLAIVRYLVAAGANVNPDLRHRAAGDSDDSNGKIGWCSLQHYSPLAAAAKSRRSEVTQFLSSMGATLLEGEDMIQDYRLSWIPFDDTGTTCFDGADTTVGEFLENIRQSAVIDMKDPAVAAIQAQERKTMTRRLLAKVANSCERLLDAGTVQDASTSLIAFVGQVSTSSSVWKSGTRAIRDICEGYMPRRLSDVVSALQVANAMRSVIPSSQLECSKKEFVNDIPRWAALLRPDDQRLFFEIASHLWGIPASTTTQKEASNFARPLMVLQYLVSHLVRTSGLFDHGFGNPRGSYRLQTLRQQNLSVLRYNRSCERRLPLTEWHPLPTQGPQESLQTNNPSPPDPEEKQFSILARITMLMAGAIFSAILLYLCLSRYGFSTLRLPILISNAGQGWASDQIIRRNYIILATYIGFTSLVDFGSEKSTDLVLPKLSPLSLILPDSPSAEGVQEHIAAVQSPYYGDYAMNNTPR